MRLSKLATATPLRAICIAASAWLCACPASDGDGEAQGDEAKGQGVDVSRLVSDSRTDCEGLPAVSGVVQTSVTDRVKDGETLALTLMRMGLSQPDTNEVVKALAGCMFDFRRSRPGDQVRLVFRDGRLDAMEYRASMTREWLVLRGSDGRLSAQERQVQITRELAQVDISIDSSLYEAIRAAGEDPSLAIDVADVFAWDIDFYRDVRKGDRIRLLVEKERFQGQLIRYGDILGVRYVGGLVGDKTYLRYKLAAGGEGYFGDDGQNAKKAFLKSPLKYTFVTSNYGGRQHPVLGFYKAHQGVDLRAAIGTPVWSVAEGTVTKVVLNDRTAGTYLTIRHANGMETIYMHLSRIAEGIHAGSRVQQKQVVAYSGNTGRSTGPHLHYGMRRGGTYIDPFSQNFPRAKPLAQEELPRFKEQTKDTAEKLKAMAP